MNEYTTKDYIGNPQGKEYKELKAKVENKKDNGIVDNVIDLHNNYSLISPQREKAKEKQTQYIQQHLMQVSQLIDKQHNESYTDPITGATISNATPDKVWVSQNVGFVFSTGAVFDKHDKAFLDEIYAYFDVHADNYLGCYHMIYSYNTDIIKKFENLQAIANGNYHICVFVIVYADKEDLSKAPEKLFKYTGIVETLIEHEDIRDELIRLMIKYGFTKTIKVQPSTASHIGANDAQTLPDIKMQYDSTVDYHKTSRELFSNIKQRDSVLGTRTRINGNVSPLRSHPRKLRIKQSGPRGDDFENRIEYDNYVSYTKPDDILGISPRINNNLQTMANNTVSDNQQVFQLYSTDGESNNTNNTYDTDYDVKTSIPSFNYQRVKH